MNIQPITVNHVRVGRSVLLVMATAALLFALAANFGMALKLGLNKGVESDAHYYLQLAKNLANGKGYSSPSTHWPNSPTMSRLPGWPILVSVALRCFPGSHPDTTMRILGLVINASVAGLMFWLTYIVFRHPAASLVSSLIYSLHPTGLYLAYSGDSEPLFLLLVSAGLLVLLIPNHSHMLRCIGSLMLGCSVLVRPNFILFLPFVLFFAGILWFQKRVLVSLRRFLTYALFILLFLVPMIIWTTRNYLVSGQFPVLSTLSGSTFYGANNSVVADNLESWGYWIFPDQIPGEKSMRELAKTMTEIKVDRYYSKKGLEHVRNNLFMMPRLWLGKLIRAYVPIPFKPTWESYLASLFRWLLYVGFVFGFAAMWGKTDVRYKISFLAIVLGNLFTVLIFWGNARFAFQVEPFTLPFLGMAVIRFLDRVHQVNSSNISAIAS